MAKQSNSKKPWSASRRARQAANYLKSEERKKQRAVVAPSVRNEAGLTPWQQAQEKRRLRRLHLQTEDVA